MSLFIFHGLDSKTMAKKVEDDKQFIRPWKSLSLALSILLISL